MLNTKVNENTITDISLRKYKLWTLDGDRSGDVISCKNGSLWVTQNDDLKDYVLSAGQNFWVTKPGMVIVQALEDSRFAYNLNEMRDHVEINRQPSHTTMRTRFNHLR